VAVFAGGWAISQLWLFWIAPILGAILGGLIHRFLNDNTTDPITTPAKDLRV
jgi:aquaporin Z